MTKHLSKQEMLGDVETEEDHTFIIQSDNCESDREFVTIDASSKFQVMVFTPHSTTVKAANQLCICHLCQDKYKSSSLSKEYISDGKILNHIKLHSGIPKDTSDILDNFDNLVAEYMYQILLHLLLLIVVQLTQHGS